jgi:hypothetical protein
LVRKSTSLAKFTERQFSLYFGADFYFDSIAPVRISYCRTFEVHPFFSYTQAALAIRSFYNLRFSEPAAFGDLFSAVCNKQFH